MVLKRLVRVLVSVQGEEVMDDVSNLPAAREGEYLGSNLPVTQADLNALSDQRKMLLEFTAKQLRKDVDYGVIPGTKKPSLYKPGAEKLARLFGLGFNLTMTDKTIDKQDNFAMFTYRADIMHLKSGHQIAQCEASCNSQEKKYKERTVYTWNEKAQKKLPAIEVTPIFDIMNTLQKMSQKRALVGGVILAVGASDFFTQDLDDVDDAQTTGVAIATRDVTSSIPGVTKVTSETHLKHEDQKQTYLAEALTDYDQRAMAQSAGFKWEKEAKRWVKRISADEAAALPFETRKLGA